jgi:hypothetical protein
MRGATGISEMPYSGLDVPFKYYFNRLTVEQKRWEASLSFQGCFGPFLGALAQKLHKASIIVHPSARPNAHMERRDFHWTDFREILYLGFLLKFVDTRKF